VAEFPYTITDYHDCRGDAGEYLWEECGGADAWRGRPIPIRFALTIFLLPARVMSMAGKNWLFCAFDEGLTNSTISFLLKVQEG
jgi:hypothetical protein